MVNLCFNRSEIAKQLKNKCYALVLCFNSFISVVLLICYKHIFAPENIFENEFSTQVC